MRKKKTRYLTRLLVTLFLGANVCTVLFMWLTVCSTFISPSLYPSLTLPGLAFPIFVFVDILFIFFWMIFHIRLVWVPIAGLAVVGAYALDYCPVHIGDEASLDSTVCVVTYNVGHTYTDEDRLEVVRFIREQSADIVCFQEINGQLMNLKEFTQTADSMGYHRVVGYAKYILTRFPVMGDTLNVTYPTKKGNRSMACWIDCMGDSVLVVSNHLESNHLSDSDKTEYKGMILEPERQRMEQSGKLLAGKLKSAASYRGAQADTLCALIDRNAGKSMIFCGDFNDTPISYTYQRLTRKLDCAFRQAGNGLGFTYRQSGIFVRIDHIFTSSDWECRKCYTETSVGASDHFPVVAYLRKKRR
jgi:endonuclease/exonuclease/phosphatase family metal-dependent hydrolase